MQNGIYFRLSDKDYHKIPRLSASGIKNMLVSIPTFWAMSWMNPKRKEDDDTDAQVLGRAYHCAFFEPDELDRRFVGAPDLSQYEGILENDTQVKAELKAMGQKQSSAGELALDRAYRLLDCGYEGPIKSVILDRFEQHVGKRSVIGAEYWAQIQCDLERIRDNPEINNLLTGGSSEVTILWTCPETGIHMKARIDKLAVDRFIDLKSFTNPVRKEVPRCIRDATQYNKYYLSMRLYQCAIDMIGALDLQIMDSASPGHSDLIDRIKEHRKPHDAWLLFQEKGGVPNILARKLRLHSYPDGVEEQAIGAEDHDIKKSRSGIAIQADMEIHRAKTQFRQAMEIYGEDETWYPFDMIGEITDADFPDYFFKEAL